MQFGERDLYDQAVAQHALLRGPVHVARSHLVYGEWLRRGGRRRDAREHPRAAYDLFEQMGARAFASRAVQNSRRLAKRYDREDPSTPIPISRRKKNT